MFEAEGVIIDPNVLMFAQQQQRAQVIGHTSPGPASVVRLCDGVLGGSMRAVLVYRNAYRLSGWRVEKGWSINPGGSWVS